MKTKERCQGVFSDGKRCPSPADIIVNTVPPLAYCPAHGKRINDLTVEGVEVGITIRPFAMWLAKMLDRDVL